MKRLKEILKHAFAVTPADETELVLPDSLLRLAEKVVEVGMASPAILLLETSVPLNFLAGQTLLAFEPFAASFLDPLAVREAGYALEDRRLVKKLIEHIENISNSRGIGP